MAACFASAYGTFVTVAPAPASPQEQQLEDGDGGLSSWLGAAGFTGSPPYFSSSLSSSSSSSLASSAAAASPPPPTAPVAYRCVFMKG